MRKKIISFLLIIFFMAPFSLYAYDLNLGYETSKMNMHPGAQTYKTDTGKATFTPAYLGSGEGTGYFLHLGFDYWGIEYGKQTLSYQTRVPAAITGTTDIETEGEFKVQYYGAGFYTRKEIGGVFLKAGIANTEETITAGGITYKNEDSSFYYKYGVEAALGLIVLRAGKMFFPAGEHQLDLTNVSLMLRF